MKRKAVLLIIISILCLVTEKSFSQNYLSVFGDSVTSWDVIKHGYCDAICSQTVFVTGDTIVGSNSYKIISGLDGFVREDTVQGKVWFYNDYFNTEFLVMDLNLNPGDTFTIFHFLGTPMPIIVDSVYYVNNLKHVQLNAWVTMCALNEKITFIEGSGTNASFHYQRNMNGSSVDSYMLCHTKDGIKVAGNLIFNDTCYVCDVGMAENNTTENGITIFPNPATNQLTIELLNGSTGKFTIAIYNILGEEILFQQSTQQVSDLNISSLNKGVYYVILNNGISKKYKRFIKE